MKKAIKILALILAFSMLFMCFTACGSSEKEDDEKRSESNIDKDNKITVNRTAKTCAANIKTIKANAANYYASYGQVVPTIEELATMFDNGCLPECPLSEDGDHTNDYDIYIGENGAANVVCKGGHSPESVGGITQEEMDNLRLTRCNANVGDILEIFRGYCTLYGTMPTEDIIRNTLSSSFPECPLSEDGDHTNDYSIVVDASGKVTVTCKHGHACENNTWQNTSIIDASKDPTCSANMNMIKASAANYYACYNRMPTLAELATMFDEGVLPECPKSKDGDHTNDYDIVVNPDGSATIACKNGHAE